MVPCFVFSLSFFCFSICCSKTTMRACRSWVVASYCCLSWSSCVCKSLAGGVAAGCWAKEGSACVATMATIQGKRFSWDRRFMSCLPLRFVSTANPLSEPCPHAFAAIGQNELVDRFGESFLCVGRSDVGG